MWLLAALEIQKILIIYFYCTHVVPTCTNIIGGAEPQTIQHWWGPSPTAPLVPTPLCNCLRPFTSSSKKIFFALSSSNWLRQEKSLSSITYDPPVGSRKIKYDSREHQSPLIVNELISIMAHKVLHSPG